MNKQDILDEIRRAAKENGGKPLGINRFQRETGIRPYDWGKYWARFGDAQKEAGFKPNELKTAHEKEFVMDKLVGLIRKLGKFPTSREIVVEISADSEFPSEGSIRRLGARIQLATKVMDYCKCKDGLTDIVELCQPVIKFEKGEELEDGNVIQEIGEVYLFKSGRYYKIGKTNDLVQRGKEIRIQLPEKCVLIHSIKTDDPSGIEFYWHRRFEVKRMQGEWFDLSSADVKAFKRWRRIA